MNEEKLYSSLCVSKQVEDIPNNDTHKKTESFNSV